MSTQFIIDPADTLHSVRSAAKRLGDTSHWSVRTWIRKGLIKPVYHAGSRVLIPESSIQHFLAQCTAERSK